MSERGGDPPQQQGCSCANMVGCVAIPCGIWLGIDTGQRYGGVGGAALGGVAGAIAGVLSIPVLVFVAFAIGYIAEAAARAAEKLRRPRP
jgi:hypothetical protein